MSNTSLSLCTFRDLPFHHGMCSILRSATKQPAEPKLLSTVNKMQLITVKVEASFGERIYDSQLMPSLSFLLCIDHEHINLDATAFMNAV